MPSENNSFVVYIDESGDEGFVFDREDGKRNGSSRWFILSALIVRKTNDLHLVKVADNIRDSIGLKNRKTIHFKEIRNHHKRIKAIQLLSQEKVRHISILVHKPSLRDRETFVVKNRLYFFTARYLLERVSWFCRDKRLSNDTNDGSALIIFSNRANTPYDEFREYIDHVVCDARSFAPGFIRSDQIKAISHANRAGLQLVDLVASSFFAGVEEFYELTEPRYALTLLPTMYSHKGKQMKYGFKIIPSDCWPTLMNKNENLKWVEAIRE